MRNNNHVCHAVLIKIKESHSHHHEFQRQNYALAAHCNAQGSVGHAKRLAHSASITSVAEFELPCKNVAPKGPFKHRYSNLCSASAGAKTLFATDDWFAAADNLLKDSPPVFDIEAYCEQGKVMDG
jgi:hypothetical protein